MFARQHDKDDAEFADVSTVESQRNDPVCEEFPEGPYGSSLPFEPPEEPADSEPPEQATDCGPQQRQRRGPQSPKRFDFENKQLHEGWPRRYPGDDS